MTQSYSFEQLKQQISDGSIDTVLTCIVDMQGRLMGKRFHAQAFLGIAHGTTHCCNYLLATDLDMATPDGYEATSWRSGYGDYLMTPDLSTLRPMPWLLRTAMVLCDVLDHHTGEPVPHAPREILKTQIKKLETLGYTANMATELEFFLFTESLKDINDSQFTQLTPISAFNEDYHILQTSKEEPVMQPLRNHLYAMGIPVEGSKGEAEAGQEELNIRYSDALSCADHHTIAKHATKEIAHQQGHSATFLAKWHHDRVGSASHIHQSLSHNGESAFEDKDRPLGMSRIMEHYMAGLLHYASDYTYFLAPYINSYKRFAKGSFAPTTIAWSVDNRTAAFRLCGEHTRSIRVECRIPGADMNPYLGQAALLAAGIRGIEDAMALPGAFNGDGYHDDSLPGIPSTLPAALESLSNSEMIADAFGDAVVKHYIRCGQWEVEAFERVVTDWEVKRGFERA